MFEGYIDLKETLWCSLFERRIVGLRGSLISPN